MEKNANAKISTHVRIPKIIWNKWAIRIEKVLHIAIIHDLVNAGNGIRLRLESDIHSNMNDLSFEHTLHIQRREKETKPHWKSREHTLWHLFSFFGWKSYIIAIRTFPKCEIQKCWQLIALFLLLMPSIDLQATPTFPRHLPHHISDKWYLNQNGFNNSSTKKWRRTTFHKSTMKKHLRVFHKNRVASSM